MPRTSATASSATAASICGSFWRMLEAAISSASSPSNSPTGAIMTGQCAMSVI